MVNYAIVEQFIGHDMIDDAIEWLFRKRISKKLQVAYLTGSGDPVALKLTWPMSKPQALAFLKKRDNQIHDRATRAVWIIR